MLRSAPTRSTLCSTLSCSLTGKWRTIFFCPARSTDPRRRPVASASQNAATTVLHLQSPFVSHFLGDTALNSEYSLHLQASLHSMYRPQYTYGSQQAGRQTHSHTQSEHAQTHTHTHTVSELLVLMPPGVGPTWTVYSFGSGLLGPRPLGCQPGFWSVILRRMRSP